MVQLSNKRRIKVEEKDKKRVDPCGSSKQLMHETITYIETMLTKHKGSGRSIVVGCFVFLEITNVGSILPKCIHYSKTYTEAPLLHLLIGP